MKKREKYKRVTTKDREVETWSCEEQDSIGIAELVAGVRSLIHIIVQSKAFSQFMNSIRAVFF